MGDMVCVCVCVCTLIFTWRQRRGSQKALQIGEWVVLGIIL